MLVSPLVSHISKTVWEIKIPQLYELRDAVQNQDLLHQQHLARAFYHAIEPTLIVSRQAGVFTRQNTTVVGGKLFEQDDVLEVHGVDGEIDFRLRAGRAFFDAAAFAIPFVSVRLTRHMNYLISR